ncbi:hypothetical protein ALC60_09226, partial [Trachymyrmex zeteki]
SLLFYSSFCFAITLYFLYRACPATVINAVPICSSISLFLLFLTCTVDVFSLTYIVYHLREDISFAILLIACEFLFQRCD